MATPKYRRDAARKVLERVLSHPALGDGLPVRFRCDPSLTAPAIRCSRFALSVWLPSSLVSCIPVLARFVRSLRRKPVVTVVVRATPCTDRTPKAPTNGTPTPNTPTDGTIPVAIAKANKTRFKPQARPKPPKPIPQWRLEWERQWDEIAAVLFPQQSTKEAMK
jgi:hypothetical protein